LETPANRKQFGSGDGLFQAGLDFGQERVFAGAHGVLGLKEAPAFFGAPRFEFFDALVEGNLRFEGGGELRLALGFLDFAVDFYSGCGFGSWSRTR